MKVEIKISIPDWFRGNPEWIVLMDPEKDAISGVLNEVKEGIIECIKAEKNRRKLEKLVKKK